MDEDSDQDSGSFFEVYNQGLMYSNKPDLNTMDYSLWLIRGSISSNCPNLLNCLKFESILSLISQSILQVLSLIKIGSPTVRTTLLHPQTSIKKTLAAMPQTLNLNLNHSVKGTLFQIQ